MIKQKKKKKTFFLLGFGRKKIVLVIRMKLKIGEVRDR